MKAGGTTTKSAGPGNSSPSSKKCCQRPEGGTNGSLV
jgi:hypothetical protein